MKTLGLPHLRTFACLLLAFPIAAKSADVLLNPGFEAGTADWSGITLVTSDVYAGTQAGKIDQSSHFKQANQVFLCGPDDLVSFGGYLRTASIVSGVAGIRVTFFNASNQALQTVVAGTASGTTGYALKDIEGVSPPAGTTQGRLELYIGQSTSTYGTAYFDDLYVDVFFHKLTDVSVNGGFENGFTGWNQGHAVLVSGANAFDGNSSSLTHGGYFKQSWFEFPVTAGQEYAASFVFRTNAATSNGLVQLRYYNAAAAQLGIDTLASQSGTNPYSLYYADGLYPPTGATSGRLVFASQSGAGTSYLDNVLITTGAPSGPVSPGFIPQDLDNLVSDSGFESGVSNWSGVALETDSNHVAVGTKAGRLAGAAFFKGYSHALIPAQAGKYYALSFLAKLHNIAASPSVGFEFYAANGTTKLGESGPVIHAAGTAGYRPFASEYFQAPASTAFIKIVASIPKDNPASFLYLDEVRLLEAQNLPVRAVPTYEAIGVYAARATPSANELARLFYRVAGASDWSEASLPIYDTRRKEYRGSIVNLAEGVDYEVQVVLEANGIKLDEAGVLATTWSSSPSTQTAISVASLISGGQLRIENLHGTPDAWIRIVGTGTNDVNAGYGNDVAVLVKNSSHVILENIDIKGGRRHGIQVEMSDSIRIANCEISGWARQPNYSDGIYSYETQAELNANNTKLAINLDAGVCLLLSSRVTVERCYMHDPRLGANNWEGSNHPAGPSAIYIQNSQGAVDLRMKGNFVVRYNDLIGSDTIRWNDAIEGANNSSDFGSFYRDSDVYGNMLCFANDDSTELDGGQMNVRFWGNRVESCWVGLSLAPCRLGPSYIWRNVFFNSGDDRDNSFATVKLGGGPTYSTGKSFLFHNTLHTIANGIHGVGFGPDSSADRVMFQAWTRNNVVRALRDQASHKWTLYDPKENAWNSFDYDNLSSVFTPTAHVDYAAGQESHGTLDNAATFVNAAVGDFRPSNTSPAIDAGLALANFTTTYAGTAPDQGAIEFGDRSLIPVRPLAASADKYLVNLTGDAGGPNVSTTVTLTIGNIGGAIGYTVRKNDTANWLSVTPSTGTLTANGTKTLTVTLLTAGLPSGSEREATLLVRLTDGRSIPITVVANMN